jgi:hypothetical protein
MLVYRPMQGTQSDSRAARKYLEMGIHEYPDDAEMWLRYGQFLAYTGTSFLNDPKEQEQWREDGARAMEHAVELGASPDRALTAANIFTKAGQIEVALESLKRAYAFTEHPSMVEVHEAIGHKIESLLQQLHEAGGMPQPQPPDPTP